MTHYNFKSIFAWNILLYTGFMAVVFIYLWMMMERRFNQYSKPAGILAFSWRLILTTGTGSIFGFLVARPAYDAAIMAPMFIIMSLAFGLAIYLLVLISAYRGTGRPLGMAVIKRLKNLLGVFVAAVMFIVAIFHVSNLYATEHHAVESFILSDGGVYTFLFWVVQILLGGVVPLWLIYADTFKDSVKAVVAASILVVIGGMAQIYVIVIGGQAVPLEIFPGFEVTSSFYDGQVGQYAPSLWEVMLGIGGFAIAGLAVTFGVKLLSFLPTSLADADVDPHHKS